MYFLENFMEDCTRASSRVFRPFAREHDEVKGMIE
jgi:hypothetical protein